MAHRLLRSFPAHPPPRRQYRAAHERHWRPRCSTHQLRGAGKKMLADAEKNGGPRRWAAAGETAGDRCSARA
jgi:hypothetical protein